MYRVIVEQPTDTLRQDYIKDAFKGAAQGLPPQDMFRALIHGNLEQTSAPTQNGIPLIGGVETRGIIQRQQPGNAYVADFSAEQDMKGFVQTLTAELKKQYMGDDLVANFVKSGQFQPAASAETFRTMMETRGLSSSIDLQNF